MVQHGDSQTEAEAQDGGGGGPVPVSNFLEPVSSPYRDGMTAYAPGPYSITDRTVRQEQASTTW